MSEEYRQEIKQLADQIQDERFLCRIYTILLRYTEKHPIALPELPDIK